MLPTDVAIKRVEPVVSDFHARYDATSRSYKYYLHTSKDVFATRFSTEYPYRRSDLDIDLLNAAAAILVGEQDYTAFCKTGGDVKHHRCAVTSASWDVLSTDTMVFSISANRFLRGMIRLIVGMCCNVSRGKLTIDQVRDALDSAERLPLDWSMPPQGLILTDIKY
jgi:tRNA pseudouridine38-40 synthase